MTRVEIGEIIESYTPQMEGLTDGDHSFIASLKSKKRVLEVATWRQLLRKMLREMGEGSETGGEDISHKEIRYSQTGAPFIEGCDHIYIGVSHNASRVAVIISTTAPCAIDIEDARRNFGRVAHKYTTPDEVSLFINENDALPLIWCAKESLIKLAPTREIDLLCDLRIISATPNTITATCLGVEHKLTHYKEGNDIVVCSLTIR